MPRSLTFFEKIKSWLGFIKSEKCYCAPGNNGKFYCFKLEQGHWVECNGPFDTLQQCKDAGDTCP